MRLSQRGGIGVDRLRFRGDKGNEVYSPSQSKTKSNRAKTKGRKGKRKGRRTSGFQALTHNAPAPPDPASQVAQASHPSPHPWLPLAGAWMGREWLFRRDG